VVPFGAAVMQLTIPGLGGLLEGELSIVLFSGLGGACKGIAEALGRDPDHAANHSELAVKWHQANHPNTIHHRADVREIWPLAITHGQKVGHLHASPDCTYFSRAKGAKPIREKERRIRSLPWIVHRWAAIARPRVITMENVAEIQDWSTIRRGRPRKARRGETWRKWVAQLEAIGYVVEWRILPGHHFGAATSRERMFLIARCDGEPIVWPAQTHGTRRRPARTMAECIDWSRPCPSIFLTKEDARALRRKTGRQIKRPIAGNTLQRIVDAIMHLVVLDPEPFAVLLPAGDGDDRRDLVAPLLSRYFGGDQGLRADRPIGAITCWDHHALLTCRTAPAAAGPVGRSVEVAALVMEYYGQGGQWRRCDRPLPTITCTARHALVTCTLAGEERIITDIGLRMFDPDELADAQGLGRDCLLPKNKAQAIELIGNSVVPQVMAAIVRANLGRRPARAA